MVGRISGSEPGRASAQLVVLASQHLGDERALGRFKKYVGSVAYRQASILDLASPNSDLELVAVAAAYHIGRTDGRALVLLRRLLRNLDDDARRSAVWALACAVPHPDILGSADGSPDNQACLFLEPTLRWTIEEIIELLVLIDEEQGIARGSFGQHVYHLLVMDPSFARKSAEAAIVSARRGPTSVASWALILAVYWAGDDGPAEFERLTATEPALADTWAAEQVAEVLGDVRYVSLF